MKIFLVVCNNTFIAQSYFKAISKNEDINVPGLITSDELTIPHEKIFSCWKDNLNNKYYYYRNDSLDPNRYNIVYVPFAGLVYTYLADKLFKSNNRYTVISINESYNTRLVNLGLYNILMYSRFTAFPKEILKQIVDNTTENNLISSDMDEIMNIIKTEDIPQTTEYYNDIKELVLTSE